MLSINKVLLLGNLTRDPELRYLPSGTAVVSFGIATNRKFKSQDGEKKEEVCFVDVSMFGRRAEVVSEYFSKGSQIYVEGRLKFEQWDGQDGQKRNKLAVIAENFEFTGGGAKKDGANDGRDAVSVPVVSGGSPEPQPEGTADNNTAKHDDVPF